MNAPRPNRLQNEETSSRKPVPPPPGEQDTTRGRARTLALAILLCGLACGLTGCDGFYLTGTDAGFYEPDYSPYYNDYGYFGDPFPFGGYYGGDLFVGGLHHHGYYGGHHFGHDFHGFHGGHGGFHGGGFHGGHGGHGGGHH